MLTKKWTIMSKVIPIDPGAMVSTCPNGNKIGRFRPFTAEWSSLLRTTGVRMKKLKRSWEGRLRYVAGNFRQGLRGPQRPDHPPAPRQRGRGLADQ